MKKSHLILLLGSLLPFFATNSFAQVSRGIGAGSVVLDDNRGHSITIETPQPGDPGYAAWVADGGSSMWKLPIPPFANANAGFVLTGDTDGQLLVWVAPPNGGPQGSWEPMNISDFSFGRGGKGGVGGSGTGGTIPIWTDASDLGNSLLTDNGTTLYYGGLNVGIGTQTPGAHLDIEGGSDTDLLHLVYNSDGFVNDILGDSWSVNNSGQMDLGNTGNSMYDASLTLDNSNGNGHLGAEGFGVSQSTSSTDSNGDPDIVFNYFTNGSNDVAGSVDFNVNHRASGDYQEVDFWNQYSGAEIVTLTPANALTAQNISSFYVSTDPGGWYFDIVEDGNAPAWGEYQFNYHVVDIGATQGGQTKHQNSGPR